MLHLAINCVLQSSLKIDVWFLALDKSNLIGRKCPDVKTIESLASETKPCRSAE